LVNFALFGFAFFRDWGSYKEQPKKLISPQNKISQQSISLMGDPKDTKNMLVFCSNSGRGISKSEGLCYRTIKVAVILKRVWSFWGISTRIENFSQF